jgi:hypothetical protein
MLRIAVEPMEPGASSHFPVAFLNGESLEIPQKWAVPETGLLIAQLLCETEHPDLRRELAAKTRFAQVVSGRVSK